jgi:CheY-like chemotaxis protein
MPKVMLAEDDATMLSLLKTLLSLEGFEVANVDFDSEKVIDAVKREKPDVLLLDVHLPNENGIEVLRRIRQDDGLKKMRIVMTSGMNMQEECLSAGANDFLLKPYMPEDLIAMLR